MTSNIMTDRGFTIKGKLKYYKTRICHLLQRGEPTEEVQVGRFLSPYSYTIDGYPSILKENRIPLRLAPVTNCIVHDCAQALANTCCSCSFGRSDIKRQHRGEYIKILADSGCSDE